MTCSYKTFSCGDWLLGLNFLLTQWYVTINVIIAVAVTDTMKVTVNVITTTAPVDNESDSDSCNSLLMSPSLLGSVNYICK